MNPRLDYARLAPGAQQAMLGLEGYVRRCGLDHKLLHLIKTRAWQINGCAYCIHMHTHEARTQGETEERLYLLDAWRESLLYSGRERAALAWTEAVTLVAQPDDVFEEARRHFSDEELANLTLAVATINAWNRLSVSFRAVHPMPARAA